MADDMMTRMLNGIIDNLLDKTGVTKEQIGDNIRNFMIVAEQTDKALKRIEHNQKLIMERLNIDDGITSGVAAIGRYNSRDGGEFAAK